MLPGFATINYSADDLDAAKRWHAELFGVEPYFSRPGPGGQPAHAEFGGGGHADELGLADRRWALSCAATGPGPGGSCTGTSTTSRRRSGSRCRWVHASTSRSPRAATRGS